jgi:hypothetical protein
MGKKMALRELFENNNNTKLSKGAVCFWIIFLLMIISWICELWTSTNIDPVIIPDTLYQSFFALLTYNIIGKVIPNQNKEKPVENGDNNAS